MRKYLYILLCFACFAAGAYAWKAKNTGLAPAEKDEPRAAVLAAPPQELLAAGATVVEVGSERITQDDVDWEYNLLTEGVFDKDTLTPIPDLGDRYHDELSTLRRTLISNIVERKLLFSFVQQDRTFGFDNASRYSACLAQWQDSLKNSGPLLQSPLGKARLKSRLCERSVLEQYLKEKLFPGLKVDDPEIVEYYKNHVGEFKRPEQVEVRQMLLTNEGEARKYRAQVNPRNFADLAKAHSIAPEADNGGRLGPFAKGSVPAVFEVAFHMKKGQISDVLKSNYGYHIIMLESRVPKKDLSLEDARREIIAVLTKKKQEDAYSKWVERALAAINVRSPKATW